MIKKLAVLHSSTLEYSGPYFIPYNFLWSTHGLVSCVHSLVYFRGTRKGKYPSKLMLNIQNFLLDLPSAYIQYILTSALLCMSLHFNCIFFSLTSLALSYCSSVALSITSMAVLIASSNLEVCTSCHLIQPVVWDDWLQYTYPNKSCLSSDTAFFRDCSCHP